jgi:hypothetical protein
MLEIAVQTDAGALVCMAVDPGICGFPCRISVRPSGRRAAIISVEGSECGQIQRFSERVRDLTLGELFLPAVRNPVYLAAQQVGCHASCVIPAAVLKTAEVAMGMAVARDVRMSFEDCGA